MGETATTDHQRLPDDSQPEPPEPLLSVRGLHVAYGRAAALHGVDLDVPVGGVVAVLGANGAGKTTLLRAITGLLGFSRGRVAAGSISVDGERVDRLDASAIVRRGVAQVLEGRRVFATLTVEENLRAGGHSCGSRRAVTAAVGEVFESFPLLASRRDVTAGELSGGQQQLLAIGRAVMTSPRLLLLDEPTLGLSPTAVDQVREAIESLHRSGTAVLVVDQRATLALSLADHAAVLASGRVVREGLAQQLRDDPALSDVYLGAAR